MSFWPCSFIIVSDYPLYNWDRSDLSVRRKKETHSLLSRIICPGCLLPRIRGGVIRLCKLERLENLTVCVLSPWGRRTGKGVRKSRSGLFKSPQPNPLPEGEVAKWKAVRRIPYILCKRLASPLLQGGRTASGCLVGTKYSLSLWERVGVRGFEKFRP
mgnify:CR=1 FL=1